MTTPGIDAHHLLHFAIRPALKVLPDRMSSPAAEALLLGSCAAESMMGRHLHQVAGGGALGAYQVEPATAVDLVQRYAARHPDILAALYWLLPKSPDDFPSAIMWDLRLGAAIARLRYWVSPEPLPAADDWPGMARYWKANFHTRAGRGTEAGFLAACRACGLLLDAG